METLDPERRGHEEELCKCCVDDHLPVKCISTFMWRAAAAEWLPLTPSLPAFLEPDDTINDGGCGERVNCT